MFANRKNQKSKAIREGSLWADILIYIFTIFILFITLYPMYYVLILSLSDPRYAITMRVYWVPKGLYLDGYKKVFNDINLWTSYRNTIMYAIFTTILMLFTCSTFAYALSYKQLKFRKLINTFLLIPMYFSGGLIPLFLLIKKIGLYNTIWALILPGGFSIWYIILMKAYFGTISEELKDSAKIDGANHYRLFLSIILPVSKPIIAVIALYTIVSVWNSWFRAAIFILNEKIQPLQIYLRRILVQQTVDLVQDLMTAEELKAAQDLALSNTQLKYTVIIIASLPMLIAYPFFQRYFIKGVMLGSLKG
jgi:putative aldouronate transport system permease protein